MHTGFGPVSGNYSRSPQPPGYIQKIKDVEEQLTDLNTKFEKLSSNHENLKQAIFSGTNYGGTPLISKVHELEDKLAEVLNHYERTQQNVEDERFAALPEETLQLKNKVNEIETQLENLQSNYEALRKDAREREVTATPTTEGNSNQLEIGHKSSSLSTVCEILGSSAIHICLLSMFIYIYYLLMQHREDWTASPCAKQAFTRY